MIMKKVCPHKQQLITLAMWALCFFFVDTFVVTDPGPASAGEETTVPSVSGTQGHDYLIGAGDVLEILVWREPDISRTVRVRPDGKISLPLVDDIQASQSTLLQLKKRITDALAGYVDKPSVYVMLQENRSKKIYIVGTVGAPGEYVLEREITILQAIAMAGGFTEWANKDDIVIIRTRPEGQARIKFNYDRVVSGKDIQQNILLKPDDVIIVP
jgi:polysaccharide export outer membrane protein